jgi:hypothetical protein
MASENEHIMKRFFGNIRIQQLVLFVVPFLLYVNTIPNDYALDDQLVITDNIYVRNGIKGIKDIFTHDTFTGFFKVKKELVQGGRYRPLSLATFAIEGSLTKQNPHTSHLINAILFSLLCIVIFKFLLAVLNFIHKTDQNTSVSFIAALLFAVHPIHTEVVANIKGRDELLALLFSLLALIYLIRYFNSNRIFDAGFSGLLLFLGLLSKENAITIPAISIVLVLLNFNKNLKFRYLTGFLFLLIGTGIYLIIRFKISGTFSNTVPNELMNNPFLYASGEQRLATIFYTLLIYLKLLVFPHPLTYDYYPYHIQLHDWSNLPSVISLTIYLFLILFIFYSLFTRKYRLVVFGLLFYLITLLPLSNLFTNTGSFMNERFVFFGSLGFCQIIGYWITLILKKFSSNKNRLYFIYGILVFIVFVFFDLTIVRNRNWKDNFTLFLHDIKISSESAKGNVAAGGTLLEKSGKENNEILKKEYLDQSIIYLKKSLSIYPDYVDALLLAGNAYFQRDKDLTSAYKFYERIFRLAPGYDLAFQNFRIMLGSANDPVDKKTGYLHILAFRPADFDANYQLGSVYGKYLNNIDSALIFLKRAVEIRPESKDANMDFGVALAMHGDIEKSIPFLEKTVRLDPQNPSNYINLGLSYLKMGYIERSDEMFAKAKSLETKLQ